MDTLFCARHTAGHFTLTAQAWRSLLCSQCITDERSGTLGRKPQCGRPQLMKLLRPGFQLLSGHQGQHPFLWMVSPLPHMLGRRVAQSTLQKPDLPRSDPTGLRDPKSRPWYCLGRTGTDPWMETVLWHSTNAKFTHLNDSNPRPTEHLTVMLVLHLTSLGLRFLKCKRQLVSG